MGVITRIFLAYGACTVGRQEAGTGERETIEDYVRFQSFFAFKTLHEKLDLLTFTHEQI